MNSEKAIIYYASSLGEANIVSAMLKSRGIENSILDQHFAGMYGALSAGGIRIQVSGVDEQIAKRILADFAKAEKKD